MLQQLYLEKVVLEHRVGGNGGDGKHREGAGFLWVKAGGRGMKEKG